MIALLVVITVALAVFDWNWARRPIERLVSNSTGREFSIGGDLDVDFFPLEVEAARVSLGNAPWSEERTMARVAHADLRLRFWPLLAGRVDITELALDRPWLRLERNAQRVGNWQFRPAARRARPDCASLDCSPVRIRQLRARGGVLELREPSLQTSIDLRFDSAKPAREDTLAPLQFSGTGTWRKAPFELGGRVDSPLALQQKAQPYRVDIRARAGDTRAHVSGALQEPLQTQDVAVQFELSGPDLETLYEFIGIVLPSTPPYALEGRLRRQGQKFSYEEFSGKVGDSDLSGDATVDIGGKRPKLTAVLKSKLLDFDDLAGFIGAQPATGEGETASSEQKEAAAAQKASGKRLPSTPIRVDRLRAMDADVRLTAARVDSPRLPLEAMSAHLVLNDGRLTIDPLAFGAAGGELTSAVRLDAPQEPAQVALEMQIRRLEIMLRIRA